VVVLVVEIPMCGRETPIRIDDDNDHDDEFDFEK
jgi:hypothetical protein